MIPPIPSDVKIKEIRFYVSGEPKGQPRPRAFSINGKARIYDGGSAEGWKGQVALAAREHLPATPLDSPLKLWLEFYFPRPRGHFRTGKHSNELKEGAPGYHLGKPDADNAAKAIMDALTTLRMWRDDSLVAHLIVRKMYDDGRGPGCLITVSEA